MSAAAPKGVVFAAASIILLGAGVGTVHGQTAANVAVVVNDNSAASRQIGDYYASAHALPAANVLHIAASEAEARS